MLNKTLTWAAAAVLIVILSSDAISQQSNGASVTGPTDTTITSLCYNGQLVYNNLASSTYIPVPLPTPDDPVRLLKSKWWTLAGERWEAILGMRSALTELNGMAKSNTASDNWMINGDFKYRYDSLAAQRQHILDYNAKLLAIEAAITKLKK